MRHLPALLFAAFAVHAQPPAFEVATIRTNHTGSLVSNYPSLRHGRLTVENATLRRLIGAAWEINEERIQGPGWLDSDRFDAVAKSPDGVPDSEFGPMLQTLLKDRFGLVLHPETREVPAWVLVVGKGGPKIHAFDPAHPPVPPANVGQSVIVGVGTMAQLAGMLENPSGRPVVDKTGLEGRFSYVLSYMRLSSQPAGNLVSDAAPDLFTAIREQLGLRLDSRKEPVEFLVVDRAGRAPAEN
ncbi:MAG TPA: TIGR03435 family protein [Bryobacteraceae bacterium]|nr:TIGR03435 family protein [Bryobacteraceae bacterium]